MFADDLERLDTAARSAVVLRWRRLRAYREFRDQSEPLECIAHSEPPPHQWPTVNAPVYTEVCAICNRMFPTQSAYRMHLNWHRRGAQPATPSCVVVAPAKQLPVATAAAAQPCQASHPVITAGRPRHDTATLP